MRTVRWRKTRKTTVIWFFCVFPSKNIWNERGFSMYYSSVWHCRRHTKADVNARLLRLANVRFYKTLVRYLSDGRGQQKRVLTNNVTTILCFWSAFPFVAIRDVLERDEKNVETSSGSRRLREVIRMTLAATSCAGMKHDACQYWKSLDFNRFQNGRKNTARGQKDLSFLPRQSNSSFTIL